jgi:hypothetical protein
MWWPHVRKPKKAMPRVAAEARVEDAEVGGRYVQSAEREIVAHALAAPARGKPDVGGVKRRARDADVLARRAERWDLGPAVELRQDPFRRLVS